MNLVKHENNGLELLIDETTDEVFASQSAIAILYISFMRSLVHSHQTEIKHI